jgi:hypothetical protein
MGTIWQSATGLFSAYASYPPKWWCRCNAAYSTSLQPVTLFEDDSSSRAASRGKQESRYKKSNDLISGNATTLEPSCDMEPNAIPWTWSEAHKQYYYVTYNVYGMLSHPSIVPSPTWTIALIVQGKSSITGKTKLQLSQCLAPELTQVTRMTMQSSRVQLPLSSNIKLADTPSVPDNVRASLPGIIEGTPGSEEPLDACR